MTSETSSAREIGEGMCKLFNFAQTDIGMKRQLRSKIITECEVG